MTDGQSEQGQSTIDYESEIAGKLGGVARHSFTDDAGNMLEIYNETEWAEPSVKTGLKWLDDNLRYPVSKLGYAVADCTKGNTEESIPEYSMQELKEEKNIDRDIMKTPDGKTAIFNPEENQTIKALLEAGERATTDPTAPLYSRIDTQGKFKVDGRPIEELCELTPGTASDGRQVEKSPAK